MALVIAFSYGKTQPSFEIYEKPKRETKKIRRTPTYGNPISSKETRSSRASTTARCVDAIQIGHILRVAESPAMDVFVRDWLRFAYDEDCPAEVSKRVYLCLMMEWATLISRSKPISEGLMGHYDQLGKVAMAEFRSTVSNGKPRYKTSEKCEILGLNPEAVKNWGRDWQPHLTDMIKILDDADREGLGPIANLLHEFAA